MALDQNSDAFVLSFSHHQICREVNPPKTVNSIVQRWHIEHKLFVSPRPRYSYKPLPSRDSIRVMKLFSSYYPQLQCQLQTILLNEPFDYEAISYVWGDPTIKVDMICDNHLVGPRCLWANAICIDQSNLHERTSQVALMKKIFAKASRVLSWLGPEDGRDADALSL
ncbi:hypothetical protein OIDMADRAFT_60808 [Oidiodendron maius Zn]|uniref:Heterokaryon incompatibility domain-containing protein n=1 Tax=Oidiodendron maius (strain Zn) TaxID=913774 RepID=A0A0C3GVY9_OIDMZ|nr:hypothetical protein OIDMADRAFT_60808 [Oidiodendron maius Zn]